MTPAMTPAMTSLRQGWARDEPGELRPGLAPYNKKGHDLVCRAPLSSSVSGRRDLNPAPQHPDCCALAWLRYAPQLPEVLSTPPLAR